MHLFKYYKISLFIIDLRYSILIKKKLGGQIKFSHSLSKVWMASLVWMENEVGIWTCWVINGI